MLVLTRKKGESILIGNDIEVKIIDIQGDKIRVGIEAPRDISVLRKELVEEVKNINKEAASKLQEVSIDKLKDVFKKK